MSLYSCLRATARSLTRSCSLRGDDGLSALLLGEDGGGDELVPLLLEEGIDGLLLTALLGLCESLVLSLLL